MGEKSKKDKATEFRRQAAECLRLAENLASASDRTQLVSMAQSWLELAKMAESPKS